MKIPLLLLLLAGCASKPAAPAADSLTRHQKDSIIAQSRLPGARGVNGAMRLQDSAAARRAREQAVSADSL
jgi:hypothetical protein